MNKSSLKVLVLVVIGFTAGIVYTISCNDGPGDASAQDGVQCEQWEYSILRTTEHGCPDRPYLDLGEVCLVPEGWAPFHADYSNNRVGVRRCISP